MEHLFVINKLLTVKAKIVQIVPNDKHTSAKSAEGPRSTASAAKEQASGVSHLLFDLAEPSNVQPDSSRCLQRCLLMKRCSRRRSWMLPKHPKLTKML
jgi:hypothetical protein